MKAIVVPSQGSPMEVWDNLELPEPGDDQILVKSVYAAINPVYVETNLTAFCAYAFSETFLIENETTTTFQDPAKGSVQFYLPEAADGKVSVTINSPGGMPIQRAAEKTAEKNVYKIQYPVKPGESRFDVSYSLPPTDAFAIVPSFSPARAPVS